MPSRRSYLLVPVVIAIASLTAGLLGGRKVSAASTPEDQVSQSMKSFTAVYDLVEQNFADKVDADKAIYKGAIPGMLRTLDPHSNFFDPKDYAGLREEQHGKYYGVGMTIGPQPRTGKTMVIHPFGGSP